MSVERKCSFLLFGAVLCLSGCVLAENLSATGQDYSIAANWTIGGATPDASLCEQAGIAYIRPIFQRDTVRELHPDLLFDCALGAFDTQPALQVRDYEWRIALEAVTADGTPVSQSEANELSSLLSGAHIDLGIVDFGGS